MYILTSTYIYFATSLKNFLVIREFVQKVGPPSPRLVRVHPINSYDKKKFCEGDVPTPAKLAKVLSRSDE